MKIAIYLRVSTEDQAKEGYSLEVQREYLLSFAKQNNYEIYKIYQDDGVSGYELRRPALSQLLQDAKDRRFDLVLVYKLDRFSRRLRDLINIVDEFESLGISLKSATEPFDTATSSGKLMFQQLGSFAEFERNRIIERVFPGMVKGVQKGNWQGARFAPFGYRYNKEKKLLEIDEREANIVKLIYIIYLAGKNTHYIVEYLYRKGYKTRTGGKFYTKLIGDILKNQIYIGKIVWNKKYYDKKKKTPKGYYRYIKNDPSKIIVGQGKHKPVISQEDFDKVQGLIAKNTNNSNSGRPAEYLLTGLLVCDSCNHNFVGSSVISNHRTKRKKRWYRCSGWQTHLVKCANKSIKAEDVVSNTQI